MANLDESNTPAGNGVPDPPADTPSRDALERRLRELERENVGLRKELADLRTAYERDKEILDALMLSGMPRTEEEFREMIANSYSFSDLIRELEQNTGANP